MTSYFIYVWYASGMTCERHFNACTQHLGELPLYALYGMLCEVSQLLPSQMRQLTLQVSIQQVRSFPVCHGNNITFLSENLSIIRFFTKSPLSLVVPRPLYSLIGFGLGLISVIAFALLRWCITLQLSIVF